ncbi:MAG: phosphoribosylglycinamide formyltransferase [Deltaproteobacteria bacterium CG_4_10_14_0_2_um_filter_43_8]|nr:MAG: phosphoribosylglycinamide formyltransferase [Deltaproteobacteria bacterium CG11_big_fil_rev_8_21_14_0_20_42_23]PJA22376.1 MAG: phosphoribosylglycinamide formyltransferase [Deltaproteobacteria bacterium CG_4_10_14_0_2_um_filter_43_8]PJC64347.1 MAG: phosphoribosylglycinamide formyltransferase [Deltaproteobacteria bacterium CG_4_9_14_0_2_um_filter_42_21]
MSSSPLILGVLISGNGSNLQAIIDACQEKRINAKLAVVVSDNKNAYGLQRAEEAGIPHFVVKRTAFASQKEFEEEIVSCLKRHSVQLVCLAGFMRIIGKNLLAAFPNHILNIHPSLLPAFPGLDAVKQAYDAKAKLAGCTVHVVDELMDHGPILLQASVEVTASDTYESLKAKILEQEHKIYPKVIQLIAEKKISLSTF